MALSDPILAGERLIPSGIRSENYAPGTAGWRIAKDGSAEFYGVVIRADLQSANYAAGAAGWRLQNNGNAELNNATVRGTLQSPNYSAGADGWRLNSAGDAELNDATLRGDVFFPVGGGASPGSIRQIGSELSFQGPYTPPGVPWPAWLLMTQDAQMELRGAPIFMSAPTGATDTIIWVTPEMFMRLFNTNDVSPGSTDHAFQIGFDTGQNLAIDNNEIMARDNGAVSTLNLQNSGGLLQVGAPILCGDMRAQDEGSSGNVVTSSATFGPDNTNGPNYTFTYPPSGRVLVLFSADAVNSGAGFSNMTIRIRNTNAAGAIQFTGGSEETARKEGTGRVTISNFAVVTGLPTSGTGFVEGLYLASSGTGTFRNPDITVVPVL